MKKLLFLSYVLVCFLPVFAASENSKIPCKNLTIIHKELLGELFPLEVNCKLSWVRGGFTREVFNWSKAFGRDRFPKFCIAMKFHLKEESSDQSDLKVVLFVYSGRAKTAAESAIECMKKFGYENITPDGYMLDLQ